MHSPAPCLHRFDMNTHIWQVVALALFIAAVAGCSNKKHEAESDDSAQEQVPLVASKFDPATLAGQLEGLL